MLLWILFYIFSGGHGGRNAATAGAFWSGPRRAGASLQLSLFRSKPKQGSSNADAEAPLGYRDLAGQSRETFLGEYSVRFPFARYLLGPLA